MLSYLHVPLPFPNTAAQKILPKRFISGIPAVQSSLEPSTAHAAKTSFKIKKVTEVLLPFVALLDMQCFGIRFGKNGIILSLPASSHFALIVLALFHGNAKEGVHVA